MLHNLSPMIPCVRGNLSQFLIYRIFFGFVLKLFACDFIWKVPKSYRRSNLICVDDFFFVIFTVTSLILFYCIVCMLYLYSLIFCFLAYNSFIDPACSCISPFFFFAEHGRGKYLANACQRKFKGFRWTGSAFSCRKVPS